MTRSLRQTTDDRLIFGYSEDDSRPYALKADSSGLLHVVGYHFNPDTLDFEVNTGGSSSGQEVDVTNFPATQPVSGTVTANPTAYAEKVQVETDYIYWAEAAVGALQASSVWRVRRISVAEPYTTTWADGNTNFDNAANNLTALSYS